MITRTHIIKARAEAARCLDMASHARRRFTLDRIRHADRRQTRGDCLSAREWLREARYWSALAVGLP